MSESENLSLNATSGAASDTSLPPQKAAETKESKKAAEVSAALKEWENPDRTTVRQGTACKCGAHTSAEWERGGREWLTAHVTEVHGKAFDWKAAIKEAFAIAEKEGPSAGLRHLADLFEEDEAKKESLANA